MDINKAIAEQKEIEKCGQFAFVEGEFQTAIHQAAVASSLRMTANTFPNSITTHNARTFSKEI